MIISVPHNSKFPCFYLLGKELSGMEIAQIMGHFFSLYRGAGGNAERESYL